MDRFKSMSMLVATVEAGSLSAASRRLATPLATVSRRISELEAHLGTRLLNRSSRRLSLTDAGRAYVAACQRILDDLGEAERAAAGEYTAPRGDLTIAASIVFGRLIVLPIVAEFLKAFPDIRIRLVLSDRVVNLFEDQVDVAVRLGELPDSSLLATRLGTIRRVVCASPAYFAAHGVPQTPEDLAAHECITFEVLMGLHAWTFRSGKTPISAPIRSRLAVNTAEAAIDAAISGLGITRVLSYQIEAATRSGQLAVALEDFELEPWPVNLVYGGGQPTPLKLRAFIDFAAPRLRSRIAQIAL